MKQCSKGRYDSVSRENHFYYCCSFLARLLFRAFCRVHLVVLETPPVEGPCIVASNHISHFEPALLGGFFPRPLDWIAMEELFHHPLGKWFLGHLHVISIDRFGKNLNHNRQSLRSILERLRVGRAIGIFPEGGIRSGASSILEKASMKPGLTTLSLLSQAPVIPCVVLGTDRLYLLKNWLRRPSLWIIIGKPIQLPSKEERNREQALLDFEEQLCSIFPALQKELCERFQLTPEDLPQTATQRRATRIFSTEVS